MANAAGPKEVASLLAPVATVEPVVNAPVLVLSVYIEIVPAPALLKFETKAKLCEEEVVVVVRSVKKPLHPAVAICRALAASRTARMNRGRANSVTTEFYINEVEKECPM